MRAHPLLGLAGLLTLLAVPARAQQNTYMEIQNADALIGALEAKRVDAASTEAPVAENAVRTLTASPEATSLPPGAWQRQQLSGLVTVQRVVCVRAPCPPIVMVGDTRVIGKWADDIAGFEGQTITINGVMVPRIIGPPQPPIFIPRPVPGVPSEPIKLESMPTDADSLRMPPFRPRVLAVDHFAPGEIGGDFITGTVLRTKTVVSASTDAPYGPLTASIPTPATVIQTTEGNFLITDPSVAERLDALEGADVTVYGNKAVVPMGPLPFPRQPEVPRGFDPKRNGYVVKGAVTSDPSRKIVAGLQKLLGDAKTVPTRAFSFNDYNLETPAGDPLYLHSTADELPESNGEYRWATVTFDKDRGGQAHLTSLSAPVPSRDVIILPFDPIPLREIGIQTHRDDQPVVKNAESTPAEQVAVDRK